MAEAFARAAGSGGHRLADRVIAAWAMTAVNLCHAYDPTS